MHPVQIVIGMFIWVSSEMTVKVVTLHQDSELSIKNRLIIIRHITRLLENTSSLTALNATEMILTVNPGIKIVLIVIRITIMVNLPQEP